MIKCTLTSREFGSTTAIRQLMITDSANHSIFIYICVCMFGVVNEIVEKNIHFMLQTATGEAFAATNDNKVSKEEEIATKTMPMISKRNSSS